LVLVVQVALALILVLKALIQYFHRLHQTVAVVVLMIIKPLRLVLMALAQVVLLAVLVLLVHQGKATPAAMVLVVDLNLNKEAVVAVELTTRVA
jgi:hypothetical protein